MNEAVISATVYIIEQLLGHDSPQPEVITALERVLAGRRRDARMAENAALPRRRFRHVMRGTFYTEIGRGELQTSGKSSLGERDELVAYRGDDGQLWFRPSWEFDNGRFIEIEAATLLPTADTRETGLREAAEIARGQIYRTCYRTWPQIGDGDRANDSEIVRHCDRLATAILDAIPVPAPPQTKWDTRAAPCPTCGFHIREVKAPPFVFEDAERDDENSDLEAASEDEAPTAAILAGAEILKAHYPKRNRKTETDANPLLVAPPPPPPQSGEREVEAGAVYYSIDGGNFYDAITKRGMGWAYWQENKHRIVDYPTSAEAALDAMRAQEKPNV